MAVKSIEVVNTDERIEYLIIGTRDELLTWALQLKKKYPSMAHDTSHFQVGEFSRHLNPDKSILIWKAYHNNLPLRSRKRAEKELH